MVTLARSESELGTREGAAPLAGVVPGPDCHLELVAVPGAPFGVEVRGVDWDDVSDADVALVGLALRRHLLVVLRGQPSPTEPQLNAFVRRFGRLTLETDDGKAHYAGHLNKSDRPKSAMAEASLEYMSRSADNTGSTMYRPGASGISELVWHNDQSHRPMLKVLSVLELQDLDGPVTPTEFRDTYTACELLDPDERARLERRMVVYYDPRMPSKEELPRLADAMHPTICPHPHTGRRALYVNDFADRLVGLNRDENEVAMATIRAHLEATAPVYVHHWRRHDLVLWDNVGLQHRRDAVPPNQLRVLRQHGGLAE